MFCVLTVVTTFVNKVFRFCYFCFSFSFLLFFVRLNELNSRFFIRDRSLSFLNVLAVRPQDGFRYTWLSFCFCFFLACFVRSKVYLSYNLSKVS